jgi:hypothetical protein
MAFTTDECRSCKAAVIWAETEAGKRMPVDAEPSADGNVRLRERDGLAPLAVVLKVAEVFGKTGLRTSHFKSCPDAADWRGKRVPA